MRELVLVFCVLISINSLSKSILKIDEEILDDLNERVSYYLGYKKILRSELPLIYQMKKEEMILEICPTDPENCFNMAALYETEDNVIYILDELNMNDDTDNSFLLHELVHAYQYREQGDALFKDCASVFKAEKEAYDIQNRYLRSRGQLFIAGSMLKFAQCPEDTVILD